MQDCLKIVTKIRKWMMPKTRIRCRLIHAWLTSQIISTLLNNSGNNKLTKGHWWWIEVKFIDREKHWYTRKVKEAIHIRLNPNNINRDNRAEIPKAWIPTIRKHQSQRCTTNKQTSEENGPALPHLNHNYCLGPEWKIESFWASTPPY